VILVSYASRFRRLPMVVQLGIALGVTLVVVKVWEKV